MEDDLVKLVAIDNKDISTRWHSLKKSVYVDENQVRDAKYEDYIESFIGEQTEISKDTHTTRQQCNVTNRKVSPSCVVLSNSDTSKNMGIESRYSFLLRDIACSRRLSCDWSDKIWMCVHL